MATMAKGKKRTLKDLYNATVMIRKPEITPVLSGSCRMQGPVDETDDDYQTNTITPVSSGSYQKLGPVDETENGNQTNTITPVPSGSCQKLGPVDETENNNQTNTITPISSGSCQKIWPVDETANGNQTNTASSQVDQGVNRHTKNQNTELGAHLGTCTVCSSLCTSCSHKVQALMGSKTSGSLDETCRENGKGDSVNDLVPSFKDGKSEIGRLTVSETSNIINVNYSETGISSQGISSAIGASQDIEMPQMLYSGRSVGEDPDTSKKRKTDSDKSNFKNKLEDSRSLEGHDDNISCAGGANEASKLSSSDSGTIDRKNLALCASPPDNLVSDEYVEAVPSEKASYLEKRDDEGSQNQSNMPMSNQDTSSDNQDSGDGLVGGNSGPSVEDSPKPEAETESNTRDLPAEGLKSVEQMQEAGKVEEVLVSHDEKEAAMVSNPVDDENDEPDILDVKVCDTCGDAGREDLLAICSRCSDGAEHTYCTREMRDKLPEGDWLCEECKLEETESQVKDNRGAVNNRVGKSQFSGHVGSEKPDLCGKSDGKDADVVGAKTDKGSSSLKISHKRNAEDAEISSVAKKQARELTIGSPKTSSSTRVGPLSRDSSFKNIDRGKLKATHQFPPGAHPVNDSSETSSLTLGTRGTFSKSNSFGTSNAKPKVKPVDEVVLQKQKSIRGTASIDTKEAPSREMGKSMSFKSINSGRLSSGESKVKMLSPRFSHGQDLKGPKPAKELNFVERKNSFKSERPFVGSSSKIASSTVSSPRVDKKPAARGETVSNSRMKDNSSLNTFTANQLNGKVYESVPNGLSEVRKSTKLAEKIKEISASDNLKAAIEAAMSKKPGLYRKNRGPEQSDEMSVSNNNRDAPSLQDQLSNSSNSGKLFAGEEVNGGLPGAWNSNADSTEQMTGVNASNNRPILPVDGNKPLTVELPSHHSVITSALLKMSTIPAYEYIWQGCFEVHRSGKLPDVYDGLQAHLSTCAAPRVRVTANKLPRRVILNEVPRTSAWPIQFVESGAKEEHIALYFFAKDYDSYEKSYTTLLENMMRNDLALTGNIDDGVEILILPSIQLPVNSQRWNMIFFLWGVFKGKRKMDDGHKYMPTTTMSLPPKTCSVVPADKYISMCDKASDVAPDARYLIDLPRLSSTETINGDSTKVTSLFPKGQCPKITMEQPERSLDCNLLPAIQTSHLQSLPEIESGPISLEEGKVDSERKRPTNLDTPVDKHGSTLEELSGSHLEQGKRSYWESTESKKSEATESINGGSESKKQKMDSSQENANRFFLTATDPVPATKQIGLVDEEEERVPNLELALGGEMKSLKQSVPNQAGHKAEEEEENDVSAALSLSLSFPYPGKEEEDEPVEQSVPKVEQQGRWMP